MTRHTRPVAASADDIGKPSPTRHPRPAPREAIAPASIPRHYVRPIEPDELARIMGEIDEADAVRGDAREDLIYRHDWGVEIDPPLRGERIVEAFAISLAVGIVAYFGAQFLRGVL